MNTNLNKVTLKERLAYGSFFMGQNMYYATVTSFLMIFYTNKVGLTPVAVGTMLFFSRFWDAINDPIVGSIVDRSKFKSGKFIPWIRVSTFLLPIGFFLLFSNPFQSALSQIIYAYCTYFIFDIFYTMSDVPIFAISTVVSEDINERTKYLSFGRLFATLGAIIPIFILPSAIESGNWTIAILIVTIVGFIALVPMSFFAKERIQQEHVEGEEKQSFAKILSSVLKNKYLLIYMVTFFLIRSLAVGQIAGNYFFAFVMGDAGLISIMGLLTIVPTMVFAIFMPLLTRTFGKRNVNIVLHIISIIAGFSLFFIGYENKIIFILLSVISGLTSVIAGLLNGLFVGDCIEYGEYTTGERNEGIAYAFQTFVNKSATAVVAILGGVLITAVGYMAGVEPSISTAKGLFSMMTLIPAIGLVLSLVVFAVFYKLDETEVQKMAIANENKKGKIVSE